ncbi:Gfo/Idh/MocA family protein [Runella slithyformis]|uniref:Oxidoreductase domain protein n=1 Tax=Runella slithyformis (strain ATCC 29530 / DSM 19594 / LMG 11500 / NCIMB 11436 / LSU 4) TaxID=761193 RepID=A0A7U4E4L8_RUNSL|nr:Gfo/Idh/MocA family oxidoreductase [Runella slithyformis]AEI47553.1 oxidoreductase domain protein [Runella slithyformis DSM 19594]
MQTSRRDFIRSASVLTGSGLFSFAPLELLASQRKRVSANEKVQLGVIGCNGMGWSDLRSHLQLSDVECVALADVDQNVLDRRAADVEKAQGKRPQLYKDYRKMLENKDIDAVIIGTPDHWHCLALTDSLAAGKHVYCEKPLANSIEECNIMLAAAKRSNKIIQIGQWQRSGSHYEKAIEYVRSGKLGNIRLVKVWAYQGWMEPVAIKPDSAVPAGVDYDMWLGPAKKRPFNANRFHFNFRWFWDYAGGLMTDWGVHEIDIALYAMNAKAPKSVMASGGKLAYPDDASETPDTLQTVYEYEGFNMLWEHATGIDGGNYGLTEGIAFIGNNGTVVLHRGGWMLYPETKTQNGIKVYKIDDIPDQARNGEYLNDHTKNFIQAIKDNNPKILKCGIETGSIAAINAHMGNIAYKTGRKVYWDATTGAFKNDAEANALIKAHYHNGWQLPKGV